MSHTFRARTLATRLTRLEAARRAQSARCDTGADLKQQLHYALVVEMRSHTQKHAPSTSAIGLNWLSLGDLRGMASYSRLARLVLKGMGVGSSGSNDNELLWDHLCKAGRVRTLADVLH